MLRRDLDPRHARGRVAEEKAVAWLAARGILIAARNVRYRVGELDIVAWDKDILCFVEVRSRENTHFGTPQASVNTAKQRRLIAAAHLYLRRFERLPTCRFDVLAVLAGTHFSYFRSAFEAPILWGYRGRDPWQVY